jgi:hypothetical protein
MKNARMVAVLISLGYAISVCAPGPAIAEMALGGEAKFKEATQKASAELHTALASLHLLLSAIDSNDFGSAVKYQGITVEQLNKAAAEYADSAQYAGEKLVNPIVATPEDGADIAYFYSHLTAYGLKSPVTEKSVINLVPAIIANLATDLSKRDIKRLLSNVREEQAFFKSALEMQFFLNSISTVFRTG